MKFCLYSGVDNKEIFNRIGFYRDDIKALSLRGDEILATNSFWELLKFRPKIVVGYFYSRSILAAFLGRLVGARILLTGGADQISPLLLSGVRLFIHRVMAFICLIISNRILLSCTDDVINFRKICLSIHSLNNKIEFVNHVVSPTPLVRLIRTPVRGEFHAFTLCWMGSVANVRRKGVDKAVGLIAKLRALGVDARLDVAGTDGPGKKFLQELTRVLDVSDHVVFLGAISEEEKNARFARDSVYLQLSEHEGFGVAAAEAFYSGMIVVHSNKGGLSDVIGEHGLIVDPSNFELKGNEYVQNFYEKYLLFKNKLEFRENTLNKYSIKMRSHAFLGDLVVRK